MFGYIKADGYIITANQRTAWPETEEGWGYNLLRLASSGPSLQPLLLPLKRPWLPQTVPPAEDQAFKHTSLEWGHCFHSGHSKFPPSPTVWWFQLIPNWSLGVAWYCESFLKMACHSLWACSSVDLVFSLLWWELLPAIRSSICSSHPVCLKRDF